jgi:hypothetical protein
VRRRRSIDERQRGSERGCEFVFFFRNRLARVFFANRFSGDGASERLHGGARAERRDVGADEAVCIARQRVRLRLCQRVVQKSQVFLEDLAPSRGRRHANLDLAVEPARPTQRAVHGFRAVGGCHHHHPAHASFVLGAV